MIRSSILFGLILLPLLGSAQTLDTAALIRQVDSLITISRTLTGKNELEKAFEINSEAEKIALQNFGRESAAYGSTCNNRGRVLYYMKNYPEAEQWYRKAIGIREIVLGKEHPDYAYSLYLLSYVYWVISDYEKAEPLLREAKDISEKVLGREHSDYDYYLFTLAGMYRNMGNYEKAEELFIEAKDLRQRVSGKEHPDYATSLIALANLYRDIGNYEKAEQLYDEAIDVRAKVLGKENTDYAGVLNSLGYLYWLQRRRYPTDPYLQKAEPLFREAKDIQEKMLGKENSHYTATLNDLANVYRDMEKYHKAEPLYQEAIEIRERLFGKNHPVYAFSLNNAGIMYGMKGDYEKAELLFLKADTILEKALGKENYDYVENLKDMAVLYTHMGQFEKPELLWLEVLDIQEKLYGREHRDYLSSLKDIAEYYFETGQYKKAESYFAESKAIWENVFGNENEWYALIVDRMGTLYRDMYNYEKAEQFYLEAVNITEKILGIDHEWYAGCLNNLATLYSDMGNYQEAEDRLLKANMIMAQTLGKEDINYANNLACLANLYEDMSYYEKAEPFYSEALAIKEKKLGKQHHEYANSVLDLAIVNLNLRNYEKAEPLFFDALAIKEKVFGKNHDSYAFNLYCLANLYAELGKYEKAESYYLEAKNIYEKTLGKENDTYAGILLFLTTMYEKQKRFSESEPIAKELAFFERNSLSRSATFLSVRELAHYSATFRESGDKLGSHLFTRPMTQQGSLPELAFDRTLFYKGFLLSTSNRIRHLALSDTLTSEKFNLLKSYEHRLATQYVKPISERKYVTELEAHVNVLEKELARTVVGLDEAMQQVTWKDVQEKLNPGEAAVEFIQYRYHHLRPTDSIFYCALVLLPGDKAPFFVPLFEEQEIVPLIKGAKGSNFQKINSLYTGQAKSFEQKSIYDLIWKPLEALLQGVKTVYCSPSGLLHRLNLSAIPLEGDKGGEIFTDRHQLVLLNSTRQLVTPTTTNNEGYDGYIVGGVRYDLDTSVIASAQVYYATRSMSSADEPTFQDELTFQTDTTSRGGNWNYLPQTATEALDIHDVFLSSHISTQLDTGYLATEESFRSLGINEPSPRILHVATHGFFFSDPKESTGYRQLESEPVFKISEHPMIRSGLIMAGAQQAWSTGKTPEHREDGILTAYEISQMDLSNTELVVLSACETGLGQVEGNEGVYGLQRAFKIAGAKYLIMSLWKVNDQSTRELMTDFYKQWLIHKLPIPEAFRTAQYNMKKTYPDAPYHWAGFVLVE